MSLFPTKFVCDVGTAEISTNNTLEVTLTVGGTVVLRETYSPVNGQIVIRGLRSVLEAAIYGDLTDVSHASAFVVLTAGNNTVGYRTLYASRLKNPRDPGGTKRVLLAGDIVGVVAPFEATGGGYSHSFVGDRLMYTIINTNNNIAIQQKTAAELTDGQVLETGTRVWIDRTECPERAVAVRFLNRYDVPQTMMTARPLDVKPAFEDKTAYYGGQRVRYSVEQKDEYTLRSGTIHSQQEYASWADLVTSRKAEVWYEGHWIPIIVTKSNFTVVRRSAGRPCVEITFQMADPKQAL